MLLLAACAEPDPDVTVAVTTSFDLVVGADHVQLFPHGDIRGSCDVVDAFADPGACVEVGDVQSCDRSATTCLERVAIDDVVLDVVRPAISLRWTTNQLASRLRITGCGRDVVLDLSADPVPTPLLQAEREADGDTTARWSQDLPSETALVELGYGVHASRCHVVGMQTHAFDYYGAAPQWIAVRAFAPIAIEETSLGPVRIWRGNAAVVPLAPPGS